MSDQPTGLTAYQREDGIFVFHFHDFKNKTIDEWVELATALDQYTLQNNLHSRFLYIVKGVYASSYAMKRLVDVTNATPLGIQESVACVAGDSLVTTIINSIFMQINRNQQSKMQIFFAEDKALDWLNQRVDTIRKENNTEPVTEIIWKKKDSIE